MDTIGVMRVLLRVSLIAVASCVLFPGCRNTPPPAACGPVPSQRQQQWQALERYAFLHFNMNTFTGREWGLGGEDPAQFDPTALDCRQWIRTLKAAGFKGAILTAKHHDGFCLWPSAYTGHSVKNSPYKDGQGDIVREFADACRAEGMKMGLYLSPWDRNRADYGKPEYIEYYRNQLRELLTGYGKIGAIWFDGWWDQDRNPGFDWQLPGQYALIHRLQPACLIGNNHHRTPFEGEDIQIFERDLPGENKAGLSGQGVSNLPLETCETMNGMWGYKITDQNYKPAKTLIHYLVKAAGKDANLLMNIGRSPMANCRLLPWSDWQR